MKKIICNDIRHMLSSFRFWAIIGLIIISTVINMLFKILGVENIDKNMGAPGLFIIGNIESNGIMCFLAPFIPAMAFGPVTINGINNSVLKGENIIGVKKFIFAKAITSMIAGCGVFIMAFLIILASCFIINPSNVISGYNPLGLFKEVYYSSVALYIFLFILHSMLFGALYALFGMGIAMTTKSNSMSLVLPGIIYHCARFLGMILDSTILNKIELMFPYLTYEFSSIDIPLWKNTLDMSLILLSAVVLIIIGYKKIKNINIISYPERGAQHEKSI